MYLLSTNFKALASVRRLHILAFLSKKPRNTSEIAAQLRISCNAASYHLKKLQREGYVLEQRIGKFTYFVPSPRLRSSKLYAQIVAKKR